MKHLRGSDLIIIRTLLQHYIELTTVKFLDVGEEVYDEMWTKRGLAKRELDVINELFRDVEIPVDETITKH